MSTEQALYTAGQQPSRLADPAGMQAIPAPTRSGVVAARHIPSLDGVRALSFLVVFAGHAGLEGFVPGGFGVTVFFFLSGFLITTLMRLEFETCGSVNLRQFWLRRALRILPAFYVVLLVATLSAHLIDPAGELRGSAVAARALHITNYWVMFHGYAGEPPGTGVYWSLAVEEHFYLLFPWLYLLMQRLHAPALRQAQFLWAICALVLLWRCVLVFALHSAEDRTYMGSDTRVDSLLFGCALAVWKNPALDAPALDVALWKKVVIPASILVLVACALIPEPQFRETVRYSLQGIALTFLFVAVIRFRDTLYFKALNWPPIVFIGALSYSLYLLHYAVILGVRHELETLHPVLQASIALLVSVALAWSIYLLIERPCADLRRQLRRRAAQ